MTPFENKPDVLAIVNPDGFCVTVDGPKIERRTPLILAQCDDLDSQGWVSGETARPTPVAAPGVPGGYRDGYGAYAEPEYYWNAGHRYCWYDEGWHGAGWYSSQRMQIRALGGAGRSAGTTGTTAATAFWYAASISKASTVTVPILMAQASGWVGRWAEDRWVVAPWVADQWVADQWVADQWAADQWAADQWAADQWAVDQWAADQWAADQWAVDQWAADQWAVDQWAADQWAVDQWAVVPEILMARWVVLWAAVSGVARWVVVTFASLGNIEFPRRRKRRSPANAGLIGAKKLQPAIGIGAPRVSSASPATPPGMRVRTGRFDGLRLAGKTWELPAV